MCMENKFYIASAEQLINASKCEAQTQAARTFAAYLNGDIVATATVSTFAAMVEYLWAMRIKHDRIESL